MAKKVASAQKKAGAAVAKRKAAAPRSVAKKASKAPATKSRSTSGGKVSAGKKIAKAGKSKAHTKALHKHMCTSDNCLVQPEAVRQATPAKQSKGKKGKK